MGRLCIQQIDTRRWVVMEVRSSRCTVFTLAGRAIPRSPLPFFSAFAGLHLLANGCQFEYQPLPGCLLRADSPGIVRSKVPSLDPYRVSLPPCSVVTAVRPASSLATGTRNGEQET